MLDNKDISMHAPMGIDKTINLTIDYQDGLGHIRSVLWLIGIVGKIVLFLVCNGCILRSPNSFYSIWCDTDSYSVHIS